MKRSVTAFLLTSLILLAGSCSRPDNSTAPAEDTVAIRTLVMTDTLDGITYYYPSFSRIDFVCDSFPTESDTDALLCCAAAFTGKEGDKHSIIAQNHVSSGRKYNGYRCPRCNAAFLFYDGRYRFMLGNWAAAMDTAAAHGGMAFAQEMMLHQGKPVKTTRPLGNVNQFRSLCERGGQLCIAQSDSALSFGTFIGKLQAAGVTEALYLDMGGWSYGFYRPTTDSLAYLTDSRSSAGFSNMLVFYE